MRKPGPLVMVAVVVLIAAATVVLSGGRFFLSGYQPPPAPEHDPCDIPRSVTGDSSFAAPVIRIAEQGATLAADGPISIGVILENTSASVAYQTRITFKLFDAARKPLPKLPSVDVDIPIILPGQRIGAGASEYQVDPVASSFEAQLGTTTWLSRATLGGFAPVTARYLRTEPIDAQFPKFVSIRSAVTSTNCRSLRNQKSAAILRDSQGDIIGGALEVSDNGVPFRDAKGNVTIVEQPPPTASCSQGSREASIVPIAGVPPTTDNARTEVYPYCDFPG
jgi:hypothetical protein